MKLTITATVDTCEQSITLNTPQGLFYTETTIKTEEKLIREALMIMGWTPPDKNFKQKPTTKEECPRDTKPHREHLPTNGRLPHPVSCVCMSCSYSNSSWGGKNL